MNFEKQFSLERAQQTERELQKLGHRLDPGQRITNDLFNSQVAIVLGDFVLSRNIDLYVTDDHSVLGRCHLPYTNRIAWFEGVYGLAHQQNWVMGLWRLQYVRQLSLLGYPVGQNKPHFATEFNHYRHQHTYDVYAIGMICAHNLGVVGTDAIALRLSLLVHDLFTPAGGDLMKFVDRKQYDEDELLSTLLQDSNWMSMCKQLGVDPHEPIRIAQMKDGILCTIRDFADTLAYVARDLFMFQGMHSGQRDSWYEEPFDQMLEAELRMIELEDSPLDLWQHVQRGENGRIVIDDAKKLNQFLFARACLFRLLYYHRQTRHIEYIIGIRMMKVLLEKGVLSNDDFFGQRGIDEILFSKVEEETGYRPSGFHDGSLGETHAFENIEHAKIYIQRAIQRDPELCGLIYTWPSATKSKTGFWSVIKDDKEMPFNEGFPKEAKRIDDLMKLPSGCFGALVNKERLLRLKPEYWNRLRDMSLDVV